MHKLLKRTFAGLFMTRFESFRDPGTANAAQIPRNFFRVKEIAKRNELKRLTPAAREHCMAQIRHNAIAKVRRWDSRVERSQTELLRRGLKRQCNQN
jgi:hypothetical protein